MSKTTEPTNEQVQERARQILASGSRDSIEFVLRQARAELRREQENQ